MANLSSWMNNAATDFEGFSRWLTKLFRPGVSTGWAVTQRASGANMSVDVAVGDGAPMTTNTAAWDWTTATENIAIGAASVTNRRDIVVRYTDLSVTNPSTSTPNNPGATKLMVVAGTPASSPSDPSDVTIQAAVGASNPFEKLARVTLTSSTTQITNAQITDLRRFMALNVQRLYGGSSNTLGHLVPNQADGTIYVSSSGKPEASDFTNPYKFSAYMIGDLTLASNTWTKAPLGSENFDTGNNFDSTTNYRFTAPISGFYQFNAQIGLSVSGYSPTVSAQGALYKNGVALVYTSVIIGSGNTLQIPHPNISKFLQLTAGDYIELFGNIGEGSRSIQGAHTFLEGYLVSRL